MRGVSKAVNVKVAVDRWRHGPCVRGVVQGRRNSEDWLIR